MKESARIRGRARRRKLCERSGSRKQCSAQRKHAHASAARRAAGPAAAAERGAPGRPVSDFFRRNSRPGKRLRTAPWIFVASGVKFGIRGGPPFPGKRRGGGAL